MLWQKLPFVEHVLSCFRHGIHLRRALCSWSLPKDYEDGHCGKYSPRHDTASSELITFQSMFTHLVTVWSHMDSTKVYKKASSWRNPPPLRN